jgi:hypothetical protein
MEHFADFGYVRDTNKQLKRLSQLSQAKFPERVVSQSGLGNLAKQQVENPYRNTEKIKTSLESRLGGVRAKDAWYDRLDPLSRPIRHSYNEYDAPAVLPKTGWSDIRKTDDRVASPTGYLGFRTDPFKGYGGMMEEPIPKLDLYPDGMPQTIKKYASRLSRKEVN